ncbi:hypothetical protein [Streptomyces sp. NPDC004065]|uniref:hypothetical protein n=1 Tax=Streptomyces sp. NPDC004065 TaxID=3364689 RepID=UPI00384E796E
MSSARRGCATTGALIATLLLAACTRESTAEDTGVASAQDSRKEDASEDAKEASSSPAKVERPLIRPDTSEEEKDRLNQVYQDCLAKHGAKMLKNEDGSWKGAFRSGDPKYPAAQRACAHKERETLTMRSAREDPQFREKADRWVACLRKHDVVATVGDDGLLAFPDGTNLDHNIEWADKCEAEVFLAK